MSNHVQPCFPIIIFKFQHLHELPCGHGTTQKKTLWITLIARALLSSKHGDHRCQEPQHMQSCWLQESDLILFSWTSFHLSDVMWFQILSQNRRTNAICRISLAAICLKETWCLGKSEDLIVQLFYCSVFNMKTTTTYIKKTIHICDLCYGTLKSFSSIILEISYGPKHQGYLGSVAAFWSYSRFTWAAPCKN